MARVGGPVVRPAWARRRYPLVAALIVMTGCGRPVRVAEATAAAPTSGIVWDHMTTEQRADYMRSTVMPEMRAMFARFDPHRYSRMGCTPCHARGRGSADFRMPNEDLLLDPTACADVPGNDPRTVETSRFMDEQVGPAMARLLGKPWNSCFWCHAYDQ